MCTIHNNVYRPISWQEKFHSTFPIKDWLATCHCIIRSINSRTLQHTVLLVYAKQARRCKYRIQYRIQDLFHLFLCFLRKLLTQFDRLPVVRSKNDKYRIQDLLHLFICFLCKLLTQFDRLPVVRSKNYEYRMQDLFQIFIYFLRKLLTQCDRLPVVRSKNYDASWSCTCLLC